MIEGYLTVKEVAEKWNISTRRVQKMCADNMIPGVTKFGKVWVIPADTKKPDDDRITSGKYINWRKKES